MHALGGVLAVLAGESFRGEAGPPTDGAAGRRTAAEPRGIAASSKTTFEDATMPAFHAGSGRNRPPEVFAGKPVPAARRAEDAVARPATPKER